MIWWISGALVVGSLLVLALAIGAVLGRLRRLNVIVRRLRLRVADAERSTLPKVTALQERAEKMQEQVIAVQERAELLRARSGGQRDS